MSGIAHGECGEIGWFPLWLSLSFLFTLGEFSLLLCSGFLIRHWLYTCSNFEFWTEELMETDGPWNIVCFDMFCPINSSHGKSYSLKTSCCCFWKMQFDGRGWVGKDHCIQPLGSIMISMVGDASFFYLLNTDSLLFNFALTLTWEMLMFSGIADPFPLNTVSMITWLPIDP